MSFNSLIFGSCLTLAEVRSLVVGHCEIDFKAKGKEVKLVNPKQSIDLRKRWENLDRSEIIQYLDRWK